MDSTDECLIAIVGGQHATEIGSSCVLLVDDNEGSRSLLARCLEQKGYAVCTAADGASALTLIAAQRFDIVLLDVIMPDISGLDVLKHIRRRYSPTELPVIMTTANDGSADIVAALEMGANDYVTKPLDFSVTVARIRTHLQLKASVEHALELEERLTARNTELESANSELRENARQRQIELQTAARVQAAFLPTSNSRIRGARFAWVFEPCQELAGDSLNILFLDPQNVAFYVLDVTGHGVAAALLAVAANRILSVNGEADSIVFTRATDDLPSVPEQPAEVARRLNHKLAWESGAEQYITLFYALFNVPTRNLTYVSAGHPGGIRISREGNASILDGGGLPIGIGEGYEQQSVRLEPGDRIYLYSDGITEAMNASSELLGSERLIRHLCAGLTSTLDATVSAILDVVKLWQSGALRDDISILAMECKE